jgi:LacI family transcriptional regulator
MSRIVTLDDIAKAAGLSRSTVSYALRNNPLASPATRALVHDLAHKMGYKPNPLVSALMTHRRGSREVEAQGVIAYLTSFGAGSQWKASPSFRRFFEGAQTRGREIGYKVEEFALEPGKMSAERMSDILSARGIRGVIVAPLPSHHGAVDLAWARFATAAIGYTLANPALHRAAFDHYHGMLMTMEKLASVSGRTIGFAFPEANVLRVDQIWKSVYLLYQSGLSPKDRVPLFMPGPGGWTREGFLAWVARFQPDAIVCGEDSPRHWLMEEDARLAQRTIWAMVNHPGNDSTLCGVDQNHELVGAAALDLVFAQLLHNEIGVPQNPKVVLVKGRWLDQGSSPAELPLATSSAERTSRATP